MRDLCGIHRGLLVEAHPDFVALPFNRLHQHAFRNGLQLRVAQQVLNRQGNRPEAVRQFGFQFAARFRRGEARDPFVHPQPLVFVGDIRLRNLDVEAKVHGCANLRLGGNALKFFHGFLEHLQIQVNSDGVQMAGLLGAQQVSRAAQFQVERSQTKARAQVGEFLQRRQPPAGCGRERVFRRDQEERVGTAIRPSDAAAQLVKVGKAEAVRVIDDQSVRARNVEPVLDERRCGQHVIFALDEFEEHSFQFLLAHLPVRHADAGGRHQPLNQRRHGKDGFHAVVNEIDLTVAVQLLENGRLNEAVRKRCDDGLNRQPPARRRFDHREVAQPAHRHVQRPGNRRCGHGQHVHAGAEFLQFFFRGHAEALLFVHDKQTQLAEAHVF